MQKLLVLYTCSPILPKWIYEHGSLYVTSYIYQLNLMLFHSTVCSGVALQLLIIMMMIIIIIIIVVQLCVVSQQWSVIRTWMNKPGNVCVCVCVCHNNDIFSLLQSLKNQFSSPLKSFYLSTEASDLKTSQGVSHQISSGAKSGWPVQAQCQGKPCGMHFANIGPYRLCQFHNKFRVILQIC